VFQDSELGCRAAIQGSPRWQWQDETAGQVTWLTKGRIEGATTSDGLMAEAVCYDHRRLWAI
jgi:hypothetical protein